MEAVCSQTSVISTNILGIPERIEDGKQGLLGGLQNVGQLVIAIRTLLTDAELSLAGWQEKRWKKSLVFTQRLESWPRFRQELEVKNY